MLVFMRRTRSQRGVIRSAGTDYYLEHHHGQDEFTDRRRRLRTTLPHPRRARPHWRSVELPRARIARRRDEELGDSSKQMLSLTLTRLEEDGFVRRTVYAEVPPKVEYDLTPLGHSFLVPMKVLVAWADEHHRHVCEARTHYRTGVR